MCGSESNFDDYEGVYSPAQVISGPNPTYQGLRIADRDDLFPHAFSKVELDAAYAGLVADAHSQGLILEAPTLQDVEFYNPGRDVVPSDFILEAITVEHFSRTERRMAAVVRVLNKHLKDSEIAALPPVVGKPKKAGAFAYVAVQLPFSDGQTVSVIFHSPEGDKKRITASDTIIAFRWLLNKRDITHVVAPEEGEEVSLETIAKRVTQLVIKNSARFESQQKEAQAERQMLEETHDAVKAAETRQSELMDAVAALAKESESVEARLSNTLALLERQRTINTELQAKIDALRAQEKQGREIPATPAPESVEPPPKSDQSREATPEYMLPVQAIVDGAYDADTGKILDLLETAIDAAEKNKTLDLYQAILDAASNRLTDLLAKEAA